MIMEWENLILYSTDICHSVGEEMAGYSHAPGCYLSKFRSSLEAGKKQLRIWLQYVCDVAKVLLYSSLSGPLVFLWSPNDDSNLLNKRVQRNLVFNLPSGREVRLTKVACSQRILRMELRWLVMSSNKPRSVKLQYR